MIFKGEGEGSEKTSSFLNLSYQSLTVPDILQGVVDYHSGLKTLVVLDALFQILQQFERQKDQKYVLAAAIGNRLFLGYKVILCCPGFFGQPGYIDLVSTCLWILQNHEHKQLYRSSKCYTFGE